MGAQHWACSDKIRQYWTLTCSERQLAKQVHSQEDIGQVNILEAGDCVWVLAIVVKLLAMNLLTVSYNNM